MIQRIIKLREREKLNQEKFAERLGLSRNFINQVENGKKNFSDRTISDICREFRISEKWLRTGEGSMYIESDTFSLDEFLSRYNVDDLEMEFIKLYFELDESTRKDILNKFKEKFMKKQKDDGPYISLNAEILESMRISSDNVKKNGNVG